MNKYLIGCLLISVCINLRGVESVWKSDPALAATEVEEQYKSIQKPDGTVGIRGLFRFCLESADVGCNVPRIEDALTLARSLQDLDPKSPTYGNFIWHYGQNGVQDKNAVEFSMQQAGLIRLKYSMVLTQKALQQLDEIMNTAIEGMHRHDINIVYTNIYLMKSWNLMVIGETLNRPELAEEGYAQFTKWMDYTARNGIYEYGAVTYYGTDLDSLALIAKYAGRPKAREDALLAMSYYWTDIAANWWASGDRYGGTNARSYDYLYGRGYLESKTWPAGWLRRKPAFETAGWLPNTDYSNLSAMYRHCTWVPPAEVTDPIRAQIPRIVVERWGGESGQRMVHYVGHDFSIASSGASRSADERTLVANLGNDPEVPQMTLFLDGRNDPFGTKKKAEKQGAMKALHVTPFIAGVQRGPELLQLLVHEPKGYHSKIHAGDLSCLLTQLTVPSVAEVWFGDSLAQPGSPEKPTLVPRNTPIFVRLGSAVIGIKYLVATTTVGTPAPIQFIEEKLGDPARHLTVVHSDTEPTASATTCVWMRGAENLTENSFAEFRKGFAKADAHVETTGDELNVTAAGSNGPLKIGVNLANKTSEVLEGDEPSALLSVNGKDLGAELFHKYTAK